MPSPSPAKIRPERAFTLVELSIVLVIIGLLAGGVLVGRDLIRASEVRAQLSQIEKYRSAVSAFKLRYNYLPGDIPNPYAAQFGFLTRGNFGGQGDGNGVLMGSFGGPGGECALCASGEFLFFWSDLGRSGLIEGNYVPNSTYLDNSMKSAFATVASYLPAAKIGNNNFISVFNTPFYNGLAGYNTASDTIYFSISAIFNMNPGTGYPITAPGLTVAQAYAIDKKTDDGLPQSGNVAALYYNYALLNGVLSWAAGGGVQGANNFNLTTTAATPGSATTCYDNNNITGPQQYSVTQNNGSGVNCALSLKF